MKEKKKGDMLRLAVKSNLVVDSGGSETRDNIELLPLCPKPRRLRSTTPEILKPLRCNKHSQSNTDGRSEVVNMITEKTICSGCSALEYPGSPPGRTPNPLVHDVLFMHQMEIITPLTRTKLSDKFGKFASATAPI